jgi:hypothetical protein
VVSKSQLWDAFLANMFIIIAFRVGQFGEFFHEKSFDGQRGSRSSAGNSCTRGRYAS